MRARPDRSISRHPLVGISHSTHPRSGSLKGRIPDPRRQVQGITAHIGMMGRSAEDIRLHRLALDPVAHQLRECDANLLSDHN